jgi:hypothetical protein
MKMDLEEILWEGVCWIHLAQDGDEWLTLVITVLDLEVP